MVNNNRMLKEKTIQHFMQVIQDVLDRKLVVKKNAFAFALCCHTKGSREIFIGWQIIL